MQTAIDDNEQRAVRKSAYQLNDQSRVIHDPDNFRARSRARFTLVHFPARAYARKYGQVSVSQRKRSIRTLFFHSLLRS